MGPCLRAAVGRSRKRLEASAERRISSRPMRLIDSTLRSNSGDCASRLVSDSTYALTAALMRAAVASSTLMVDAACSGLTVGMAEGGSRTSSSAASASGAIVIRGEPPLRALDAAKWAAVAVSARELLGRWLRRWLRRWLGHRRRDRDGRGRDRRTRARADRHGVLAGGPCR